MLPTNGAAGGDHRLGLAADPVGQTAHHSAGPGDRGLGRTPNGVGDLGAPNGKPARAVDVQHDGLGGRIGLQTPKGGKHFGGVLEPVEEQGSKVRPVGQDPADLQNPDAALDRCLGGKRLPGLFPGVRLSRQGLEHALKNDLGRPSLNHRHLSCQHRQNVVHHSRAERCPLPPPFSRPSSCPWPMPNRSSP